jgi:cytoskeleton protein RodZ
MGEEDHRFYERAGSIDIGAALERARNDRGLSLEEVEQATKIRKRYLQGLERDDYSVLPDAVYAQGFLKTYANYLGLDGEELARELKSHRRPRRERHTSNGNFRKTGFDEPLISPGGLAGAERRRVSGATILTLLAAVLVIAGVIGALYYVGSLSSTPGTDSEPASGESRAQSGTPGEAPEEDEPAPPPEAEAGEEQGSDGEAGDGPGEQGPSPEGTPTADTFRVGVSVEGSASWLSIRTDGAVAYEQTAQPGFSETFEAEQEVSISTGNAGAVSVEVNGRDAGVMGAPGEVIEGRSYTPESAG